MIMSLIAPNQIYKRMIMQLLISLNRARLLVQSHVALTKPASTGSLQIQVTCTESCCSDKACKYGLLVQSPVALCVLCRCDYEQSLR